MKGSTRRREAISTPGVPNNNRRTWASEPARGCRDPLHRFPSPLRMSCKPAPDLGFRVAAGARVGTIASPCLDHRRSPLPSGNHRERPDIHQRSLRARSCFGQALIPAFSGAVCPALVRSRPYTVFAHRMAGLDAYSSRSARTELGKPESGAYGNSATSMIGDSRDAAVRSATVNSLPTR